MTKPQPAFHAAISAEFGVTLYGEQRVALNAQVSLGTHLDSGGRVSYFWSQRSLMREYDDWLRHYESS